MTTKSAIMAAARVFPEKQKEEEVSQEEIFLCWKLLGLIPGGMTFSQLNRGVKDAMSATTKKDV